MLRILTPTLCALLLVSGCDRAGAIGRALNPGSLFSGPKTPTTLEPREGYPDRTDLRAPAGRIANATLEPLVEGKLLVVTLDMPSSGWWDGALITTVPHPGDRIVPDEDGVLRLLAVANPPRPGSEAAAQPQTPGNPLRLALTLSHVELGRIRSIEITSAGNTVTLKP